MLTALKLTILFIVFLASFLLLAFHWPGALLVLTSILLLDITIGSLK